MEGMCRRLFEAKFWIRLLSDQFPVSVPAAIADRPFVKMISRSLFGSLLGEEDDKTYSTRWSSRIDR